MVSINVSFSYKEYDLFRQEMQENDLDGNSETLQHYVNTLPKLRNLVREQNQQIRVMENEIMVLRAQKNESPHNN
jgi:hypothetical protein